MPRLYAVRPTAVTAGSARGELPDPDGPGGAEPDSALERPRGEGLVEAEREEIVASRLRRYYRLTATGETRLAGEAARLHANAAIAASRLDLKGAR